MNKKKVIKRLLLSLLIAVLVLVCAGGAMLLGNMNVALETVDYYSMDLPAEFYGYRIMCIADFHNAFYFDQVAELVNEEKPDVVLFLGDMTELSDGKDWENVLNLLDTIEWEAPVYGVLGNHEVLSPYVDEIESDLEANGMYLLNNEKVVLSRDGASIELIGIRDIPDGDTALEGSWMLEQTRTYLKEVINEKSFSLVAAHRPTLYPYMSDLPATLMLSGHKHGGVVRLPKVGGLIDVEGGYFPDYDKGFFKEGEMELYVSSGCDFLLQKPRIFNRPSVTLLTLKR